MSTRPPAKPRVHTKAKAAVELVKSLKKTSREINATKSKRLTALVKVIEDAKANMAKYVLVMAKALKEIRDDELWRTDTADGFDAYVSKRGLVSAVYARKLIDVVEALPKSKSLPYPVEKVWELTRYAKDADRRGGLQDLLAKDATIDDRPVSDLTADEIHDHRMKLAENVQKRAKREPDRATHEKLARTVEAALKQRFKVSTKVTLNKNDDTWTYELSLSAQEIRAIAGLSEPASAKPVKSAKSTSAKGTPAKRKR